MSNMSIVNELKERLDIVQFIGRSVPLQRAGRNFKALCPFHAERTPSFIVFPDRQTWHCFGACGVGGDVFGFLMRKEGVDFVQALHLLAAEAGLALPDESDKRDDARHLLHQMNEEAIKFFRRQLTDSVPGRQAHAYLQRRGVSEQGIKDFELGYSLDSWDALATYLRDHGFKDDDLLAAGLVVHGERGTYDRFRHRLMFPIRDANGRAVGFGGRSLPGPGGQEVPPKYLNTPQTGIFDKGRLLYGLERAKVHIQSEGKVVIVEGYMDLIAAHEHGFCNVVASMGTALTSGHVGLLRRYTRNLCLALDADPAGVEAALRVLESGETTLGTEEVPIVTWTGAVRQISSPGVDVGIVALPAGMDPDQFVRSDPDGWKQAVAAATPMVDFVMATVLNRVERSNPVSKSEAVQRLLPLMAAIPDPVIQAHYVQRLALSLHLREEDIRAELRQMERKTRNGQGKSRRNQGLDRKPSAVNGEGDRVEEYLLALLLRNPLLKSHKSALSAELFLRSENGQVFDAWRTGDDDSSLRNNLAVELHPHLDRLWKREVPLFADDKEAIAALNDCLNRIRRRRLALAKEANLSVLTESESGIDLARALSIAMEKKQGGDQVDEARDDPTVAVASLYLKDTEAGLTLHRKVEAEEMA